MIKRTKDLPNIPGIYLIKTQSGPYFGRSLNIKARIQAHLRDLKKKKHHCQYLQRTFNKYGENSLDFKVIYTLSLEKLGHLTKEQVLNLLKVLEQIYLTCFTCINGEKISSGKKSKLSEETKQLISNANKGRKLSEDTIRKIIETKKAGILGKNFKIYHKDKGYIEILNLRKFCLENNLSYRTMQFVVEGKRPSHKNIYFTDENTFKKRLNIKTRVKQSPIKGINWDESEQKWVAQFFIKNQRFFVGRFKTEQEAILKLEQKKKEVKNNELLSPPLN
jgi:hypothetical protein